MTSHIFPDFNYSASDLAFFQQELLHPQENVINYQYPCIEFPASVLPNINNLVSTGTETETFTCSHPGCSYTTNTLSKLKSHQRIHAREKPYRCSTNGCTFTTVTLSALKAHERTHSGVRPFKCTFTGCTYRAARLSDLKTHIRTHTGERPYKCIFPGCNYAGSTSSHLKVHERTHTGVKPYKCKFPGCFFAAARLYELKKHEQAYRHETLGYSTTRRPSTRIPPSLPQSLEAPNPPQTLSSESVIQSSSLHPSLPQPPSPLQSTVPYVSIPLSALELQNSPIPAFLIAPILPPMPSYTIHHQPNDQQNQPSSVFPAALLSETELLQTLSASLLQTPFVVPDPFFLGSSTIPISSYSSSSSTSPSNSSLLVDPINPFYQSTSTTDS